MQGHPVQSSTHRKLADSKPDIPAFVGTRQEVACFFDQCIVGRRQVSRSAEQEWNGFRQGVDRATGCRAGSKLRTSLVNRHLAVPASRQFALHSRPELLGQFRICFGILGKTVAPSRFCLLSRLCQLAVEIGYLFRYVEFIFIFPIVLLLGQCRLFLAERSAVRFAGAALVRASVPDDGFYLDQRRTIQILLRLCDCRFDRGQIVSVLDAQVLPAVRLIALRHAFRERQGELSVQRNIIGIVQNDHFAQFKVGCQRRCLAGHAFHQVAVAANRVRVVVDDVEAFAVVDSRHMLFGHRHADSHRDPLSQWTRGRIHPRRMPEFRVPRRFASPLTEIVQVFQRNIVFHQVQHRV